MNGYDSVLQFHEKHGFAIGIDIRSMQIDSSCSRQLSEAIESMEKYIDWGLASWFQDESGDPRYYRFCLIAEELMELGSALLFQNEKELADALGDLRYVVDGTAVTFGVPIDAVFEEIHASNMSKKKRDVNEDPRMRDKGPDYFEPDIIRILKENKNANNRRC